MEVVSSYNADSWSCFYRAINIFSFPLFCVFFLSPGAAKASCTWSCRGQKRATTSWVRTAALLTACRRSSISIPAGNCPSREPNTCLCSTLWPSRHYRTAGHLKASLPRSTQRFLSLWTETLLAHREDGQQNPGKKKKNCCSSLTQPVDGFPTYCTLSYTHRLNDAEVFIILFYLWRTPTPLRRRLTMWSFHWFLSWFPLALNTTRKVQHCNICLWSAHRENAMNDSLCPFGWSPSTL